MHDELERRSNEPREWQFPIIFTVWHVAAIISAGWIAGATIKKSTYSPLDRVGVVFASAFMGGILGLIVFAFVSVVYDYSGYCSYQKQKRPGWWPGRFFIAG